MVFVIGLPLLLKNSAAKCLDKKNLHEFANSKSIQAVGSYGMGSDIKTSPEKADIKKSDGNSLIAETKAQKKISNNKSIGAARRKNIHNKQFCVKVLTVKSLTRKITKLISFL